MAIKNDDVSSKVARLPPIVMQGDTFGPLCSTSQVDDIARHWENTAHKHMFKYKDILNIGILGMVDDQLGVAVQGVAAQVLNSGFNAKTAEKGLHFGEDKCVQMII